MNLNYVLIALMSVSTLSAVEQGASASLKDNLRKHFAFRPTETYSKQRAAHAAAQKQAEGVRGRFGRMGAAMVAHPVLTAAAVVGIVAVSVATYRYIKAKRAEQEQLAAELAAYESAC